MDWDYKTAISLDPLIYRPVGRCEATVLHPVPIITRRASATSIHTSFFLEMRRQYIMRHVKKARSTDDLEQFFISRDARLPPPALRINTVYCRQKWCLAAGGHVASASCPARLPSKIKAAAASTFPRPSATLVRAQPVQLSPHRNGCARARL